MWNSITNQWGHQSTNTNTFNTVQQADAPIDFILNEKSRRANTPADCAIKLWPHQEAMLYRIRAIETAGYLCQTQHTAGSELRYMDKREVPKAEKVILGVMNDPPGSGKTYAILSHILSDSNTGTSIIIVPQNIYAQWRESIEKVFKHQLSKCLFSMSYADVMNIYSNPQQVNYYKVILLQDSFAEAYLKVLNDNSVGVCRIVIDEVDIMDKFVCSSVKTKFVWLMSASYKDQLRLGPYHIGDHRKVVCKCEDAFVQKSLNLPEPVNKTIKCDDDHIQMFKGIVDEKQLKALNAGDHNILNRIMNKAGLIHPGLYRDFAGKYAEYLLQKAELLPEAEKELEGFRVTDDRSEKERNILIDKIVMLKRFKQNAELLEERRKDITDLFLQNCKEKYLEGEFIEQMEQDKQSKWLVFNDNGNVLVRYQELLGKRGVKTAMLDGGNQKLIEKTLLDYKEGAVQVLLLNSMIEGAGMNLENTTHLLFMHKTEEKFINQVVGRAQRYGRTRPLNIVMLFNKNE